MPLGALAAVRLFGALADGAMLPYVVYWATTHLGLTGAVAGAVFLAQAVGEMSGGLLGGVLSDRLGHRRVLIVATCGMIAGYGSLAVIDQPLLAIAAFFVAGLFESAFHPAIGALVADTTAPERLTNAYGWIRIGAHTGHIVGPVIGAAALLHSLSAVFLVAAGALTVSLLVILFLVPRVPDRPDEPEAGNRVRLAVTSRPLILLVIAGGLLAITLTWFEADGLTILNSQHSLSTTSYATLFTVMAVVTVALQIPVTRLTVRFSASSVLVTGALVQGAGLAVLTTAGFGYPALLAAALLLATGQMLYGPTASTLIALVAPPHARGTFQAAFSVTEDIGSAIGPITGLAVVAVAGADVVWSVAAVICVVTAVTAAAAARGGRSVLGVPGPVVAGGEPVTGVGERL